MADSRNVVSWVEDCWSRWNYCIDKSQKFDPSAESSNFTTLKLFCLSLRIKIMWFLYTSDTSCQLQNTVAVPPWFVHRDYMILGRFRYTSSTMYTYRSCADVISRCVVFILAACYPSFLYVCYVWKPHLYVQSKMYRFLSFLSRYTAWATTCSETEIIY